MGARCDCKRSLVVPAAQTQRQPGGPVACDTCAVIAAGGSGERFGDPRGKQFVDICGLPMVAWSLIAFDAAPSVGHIVIVCAPDKEREMLDATVLAVSISTPVTFAAAGSSRQDSCRNGLAAVPSDYPIVAIHDGARPLVTVETIEAAIARVRGDQGLAGAICGQPAIDTLKLVEGDTIISTPDRSMYWTAQTPQVFRTEQVRDAHERARAEGYVGTDDASLVERIGGRVAMVAAQRDNIKVTVPEDLRPVEAILSERLVTSACGVPASEKGGDGA